MLFLCKYCLLREIFLKNTQSSSDLSLILASGNFTASDATTLYVGQPSVDGTTYSFRVAAVDSIGKRAREAADAAKDRDAKAQDAEEAAAQKAQEEEDKRRLEAADMEDAANQDRDNQQREEFRKARSKKFEAARDSGLGPLIADQLAAAMKQGGDISPLKKALQERLTATFGLAAGPAMLKDAETDAKRQVMLDWVNGKDEKHRNSAVMSGGADWARTIQAGVGGGKDREQLQRLDRIAAVLAEQLKVAKEAKAQPPAPGRAFVGK